MSLIIYHEKAIYADRSFATANMDGDVRYDEKDKLFISPDRQIAFAACGERPEEGNLHEYFSRLRYIFKALITLETRRKYPLAKNTPEEKRKKIEKNNDQLLEIVATCADEIRKHQDGKIFAISNTTGISFDFRKFVKPDQITSIFQGPSTSYGTGSAYWDLFANNGLHPADCYAHAWKVDETISKNFDTVAMADLQPLTLGPQ